MSKDDLWYAIRVCVPCDIAICLLSVIFASEWENYHFTWKTCILQLLKEQKYIKVCYMFMLKT